MVNKAKAPAESVTRGLTLLEGGKAEEALALLGPLQQRFPNDARLLRVVAGALERVGRYADLQDVLETLVDLETEPEVRFFLAATYARNGYPLKALDVLEKVVGKHPEHPRSQAMKATVENTRASFSQVLTHLPEDERRDVLRQREHLQFLLERERWADARRAGRKLLDRWPEDVPTLNLVAQVELMEGNAPQALELAEATLLLQRDNVYALGAAIRALCLMARFSEAKAHVPSLVEAPIADARSIFEKARALVMVGEYEPVPALVEQLLAQDNAEPGDRAAVLAWGGVARAAAGDDDGARDFLRQAAQINRTSRLIVENLVDLNNPIGSRDGPFPLPFEDWVGQRYVKLHGGALDRFARLSQGKRKREEAVALLRAHPYLESLLPTLLERADPLGRRLARDMAMNVESPACVEALHHYIGGQGGTDADRWAVVEWLREKGHLTEARVHFWWKGTWRDMSVVGLKLRDDAEVKHRKEVAVLLEQARHAYEAARYEEAEGLLLQARGKEATAGDIQLDLATVYMAQGRFEEAGQILVGFESGRAIALRIDLLAALGHAQDALGLIVPAMSREWQRTDFARFCDASVRVQAANGNEEATASIQGARRLAVPDDAVIPWPVRLPQPHPQAQPVAEDG